jgi:DNA-binding NarL/FixJ family response regulator
MSGFPNTSEPGRGPVPSRASASQTFIDSDATSLRRPHCPAVKLAIVDEFPMRRSSIEKLLRAQLRERPCCFSTTQELLSQLRRQDEMPRGVIFSMGCAAFQESSLESLASLNMALEFTPVIVLSDMEGPQLIAAAFRTGIRGFIPTSMEPRVATQAMRLVLSGGIFVPPSALTKIHFAMNTGHRQPTDMSVQHSDPVEPSDESDLDSHEIWDEWPDRRRAVLSLIVKGWPNKDIAQLLQMNESTVKSQVRQIMRKLGANNRTQIALYAKNCVLEAEEKACESKSINGPLTTISI